MKNNALSKIIKSTELKSYILGLMESIETTPSEDLIDAGKVLKGILPSLKDNHLMRFMEACLLYMDECTENTMVDMAEELSITLSKPSSHNDGVMYMNSDQTVRFNDIDYQGIATYEMIGKCVGKCLNTGKTNKVPDGLDVPKGADHFYLPFYSDYARTQWKGETKDLNGLFCAKIYVIRPKPPIKGKVVTTLPALEHKTESKEEIEEKRTFQELSVGVGD